MSEVESIITISSVPGVIEKDEILIRIFYHPDHIDELGNIKASAIPSDDLKSRGVSVDRKSYVEKRYIETNIQNSVARKEERNLAGFGLISHETVLGILDVKNSTALHVKSDPISNNQAHAIILAKNNYLRSELKKLRKDLVDKFKSVKSIEEALS